MSFFQTRNVLIKKQKSLKKQGKGNMPNAASPLTDDQINQLLENGQLGMSNPESILNTLWLFNTAGFGLRGTDEHRQMCFGDIKLKTDDEGEEFIEFTERSTKTRQGDDTKNIRPVKPKLWSNSKNKDRCPVSVFKKYIQLRPKDYCNEDDPFYIATNTSKLFNKSSDKWFKKQPVGVNKIKSFMKRMSTTLNGSDAKGLSNHSARKYLIQKLTDSNIPPTDIVQISGHKNISSVNSYSHLNKKSTKLYHQLSLHAVKMKKKVSMKLMKNHLKSREKKNYSK